MTDVPPALQLTGVTKRFPGVLALADVDFELRPGEVHALCGENGAGKSTLIKILSGIWPHGSYEGTVHLWGREARLKNIDDAERAGVAVIHQELALVPEMTVAQNVFLGNEPTVNGLVDWHRVYARTTRVLEEYGLDLDPHARVSGLSVGRQQLVEIVKALSKNKKILLLDEPTAALTEAEAGVLLEIIANLRRHEVGCIYISHKLDEVFAIADRITVLRDGRAVATVETGQSNKAAVITQMVGRSIGEYYPRRSSTVGGECLTVTELTVTVPQAPAPILERIELSVHRGEVLGIGGLMGAGRSALLLAIFAGIGEQQSGEVRLAGHPYADRSPGGSIARGLILVSEDRRRYGLVLEQSIGFNLSLSALKAVTERGLVNGHAEFAANQQAIQSLGIKAPGQEAPVATLSGGNQQKVVLGKALMTEPQIVFLDEPTRGIDVGAKVEVYELINRLTEAGKAVVLVSSELPELMGMSDRMVILSNGKIGGEFHRGQATPEEILTAAMAHH